MTDSSDVGMEREIWEGRYLVRAEISYRDRRGKSSTFHVIHFQPDMSLGEASVLLESIGFTPDMEGFRQLVSQARDTFSEQQADRLVSYLNNRRGIRAYARPAHKPLPSLIGASAIPTLPSLRDQSVHKLYLDPGYHLDFKVESVNMKLFINMTRLIREFMDLANDSGDTIST